MAHRFSIILPLRNGGAYLKECVHSVLSQTYTGFNFIILENGSTDGSLEWLQSLKDDRIKIITADHSLSIQANWGRIVGIEKNEFMTLIGHDDMLYPNYLQTIDELINKFPDASLYQTHFHIIDAAGTISRTCKPMPEIETAADFLQTICSNAIDIMGTGFMMRSKDYDAVGGIPPYPNLLFADYVLWLELTWINNKKVTSKEICFAYRMHQSVAGSSNDLVYIDTFKLFINYLSKLRSEDTSLAEIIDSKGLQVVDNFCKGIAHRMLRVPLVERQGRKVAGLIEICRQCANTLIPAVQYKPSFTVRIAELIDSNIFSRKLFLQFKRVYNKPFLRG